MKINNNALLGHFENVLRIETQESWLYRGDPPLSPYSIFPTPGHQSLAEPV